MVDRCFLFSLLVHAALLGVLSVGLSPKPPLVPYGIDFLSRGSGFGPGEGGGAPPVTAPPGPLRPPAPEKTAPPDLPKTEDPQKVTVAKPKPEKKAPAKTADASPKAPPRKTASVPKKTPGQPGSGGLGGKGIGTGQGDGSGVRIGGFGTGGGGLSLGQRFPYAWYVEILYRRLWGSWEGKDRSDRACTVAFSIKRDGAVEKVEVAEGSGDSLYDLQARRAVEVSSPFPPLPEGYPESTLRVQVRFKID
jgi:TonB family protein